MRAVSQSRRSGTRAVAGFSLKPVAVLLCAVFLVRFLFATDVLQNFSHAVSGWTSGDSFAALAFKGAGVPAAFDEGDGWAVSLLLSQSSLFAALPRALVNEEPSESADEEPDVKLDKEPYVEPSDATVSLAVDAVLPPIKSSLFPQNLWYRLQYIQTVTPLETQPEQTEQPEQAETSNIGFVDDRQIPVSNPGDPGAKRVLEVTLTVPKGAPTGVYINNKTNFSVSVQEMLSKTSALKESDSKNPQILIIHTHGSESFLPDERDYYIPTDIERTEDTRYNVVKLGEEMEKSLAALGLNVLHDRNIYDYPSYSGSYGRSLNSMQKYMKDYPSIQVVIDIHRDSIESADKSSRYKAISQTEKGKAAQMMIVVGTNGSGLIHPNWKQNLAFACDIDKAILDTYPTLMRPVSLRKERFNQHATTGSIILEVGTAANTLSEALLSIELFCETAGARLAEQLLS